MAKRKTSRRGSTGRTKTRRTDTLDDPPVLSLSKRSAELLAELAKRERRDRSDILNDAIAAYAASEERAPRRSGKRK